MSRFADGSLRCGAAPACELRAADERASGQERGAAPRRLQRDRHCSLDGLHGVRRRGCRGGGHLIALRTAAGTMYNCRCGEASARASLRAMQPPQETKNGELQTPCNARSTGCASE